MLHEGIGIEGGPQTESGRAGMVGKCELSAQRHDVRNEVCRNAT
jgi:hypothetical protein